MFSWIADPRFWTKSYANVSIDRPIFLLGTQGVGLTLLTRMLRRQGRVVAGAGSGTWWSGPDEIQNIYGPWLPANLTGTRWKVPPHPLFGTLRSWSLGTDTLIDHYRCRAGDLTDETRVALRHVISYALARHGGSGARFLDKSQTFMLRAGMIHAALAECNPHFVLMVRDPYVSVYRAAIGKARDMADLKNTTTLEQRLNFCAQHYTACMTAVFDDAIDGGFGIYELPFERLLADPEGELRALCGVLELDFHADMLPAPNQKIPFASRFKDRWYPIATDINARYLIDIPQQAIDIVNAHCGNLITRLGYPILPSTTAA